MNSGQDTSRVFWPQVFGFHPQAFASFPREIFKASIVKFLHCDPDKNLDSSRTFLSRDYQFVDQGKHRYDKPSTVTPLGCHSELKCKLDHTYGLQRVEALLCRWFTPLLRRFFKLFPQACILSPQALHLLLIAAHGHHPCLAGHTACWLYMWRVEAVWNGRTMINKRERSMKQWGCHKGLPWRRS